jgi:hypothetical protein
MPTLKCCKSRVTGLRFVFSAFFVQLELAAHDDFEVV